MTTTASSTADCALCARDTAGLTAVHWRVIELTRPGARVHLRFIPLQHLGDLIDLSPGAREELWQLMKVAYDKFDMTFYGFVIRTGDHAYADMLVGDVDAPGHSKLIEEFR